MQSKSLVSNFTLIALFLGLINQQFQLNPGLIFSNLESNWLAQVNPSPVQVNPNPVPLDSEETEELEEERQGKEDELEEELNDNSNNDPTPRVEEVPAPPESLDGNVPFHLVSKNSSKKQ